MKSTLQNAPTAAGPASTPSRYRHEDGVPCIDVSAKNIERLLDNRERIGRTGRLFKGRPRSTPGKTALLFRLAVG